MKNSLHLISLISILLIASNTICFAQPINDLCQNATELTVGADETSMVWTKGTTIGAKDALNVPGPSVCSSNFYRDDVWYKFQIPGNALGENLKIVVRKTLPKPLASIGMAVYLNNDCSSTNQAYQCTNFGLNDDAEYNLSKECLGIDKYILIRVWSSSGGAFDWDTGEGNFEISAYFYNESSTKQILWGANGEGSFDGGLNDWTTTSESCNNFELWKWSNTTFCTLGAYSAGGGLINSATNCNGAACFDSDYYDNGGNLSGAGSGPCPAPQIGTLESPSIDLSGFPDVHGVDLIFNQATRQFQSDYYVEYSIDDGITWTSIQINTKAEDPILYAQNGPNMNNVRRIALPGAAGKPKVKVRFRYEANYYYWIIDDVKIVARNKYDLALNDAIAVAPNKIWQNDQLIPFGGMLSIKNIGAEPVTNSIAYFRIQDPTGTEIWSDSVNIGTVPPDSSISRIDMPGKFSLTKYTNGTYTGIYQLSMTEPDSDTINNIKKFIWTISDTTMAKENASEVEFSESPSNTSNFSWGNVFHVVNGKDKDSHQLFVRSVSVGIVNPDALYNQNIDIDIFAWKNTNNDSIAQAKELTKVAYCNHYFDQYVENPSIFNFPVYDYITNSPLFSLTDNTDYIVAVNFQAPADQPDLPCLIGNVKDPNYTTTDFKTSLSNNGPLRFSQVKDEQNKGYFEAKSFSDGLVPMIRMNMGIIFCIDFPNPVIKGTVYLDVNCNGVKDSDEVYMKGVKINQTFDPINKVTTNKLGQYSFLGGSTPIKFSPEVLDYGHFVPASVEILGTDILKANYDFGFCPDSLFHDIKVEIIPKSPLIPSKNTYIDIIVENKSWVTESADLNFEFTNPNASLQVIDTDGGMLQQNKIVWNIPLLKPFEIIKKRIALNTSPSAQTGTVAELKSEVALANGNVDIQISDNIAQISLEIKDVNSPINKSVDKKHLKLVDFTNGTELKYLISFQNTNNTTLSYVNFYDTLSPDLDVSSFKIIYSSHPVEVIIIGNLVQMKFDNINLPNNTTDEANSFIYASFNVKTKPNTDFKHTINNSAAVTFNSTAKLLSNTTETSLLTSTQEKISGLDRLNIYPNPIGQNGGLCSFQLEKPSNLSWYISDVTGRKILSQATKKYTQGKHFIEFESIQLIPGNYQFHLISKEAEQTIRMIKQ